MKLVYLVSALLLTILGVTVEAGVWIPGYPPTIGKCTRTIALSNRINFQICDWFDEIGPKPMSRVYVSNRSGRNRFITVFTRLWVNRRRITDESCSGRMFAPNEHHPCQTTYSSRGCGYAFQQQVRFLVDGGLSNWHFGPTISVPCGKP